MSEDSGQLDFTEMGSYPMKCVLLDTKNVFILDTGASSILVRVGKGTIPREKMAAFTYTTVRSCEMYSHVSILREGV